MKSMKMEVWAGMGLIAFTGKKALIGALPLQILACSATNTRMFAALTLLQPVGVPSAKVTKPNEPIHLSTRLPRNEMN